MKQIILLALLCSINYLSAQNKKALVGGTLIGDLGGMPTENSVIIIEGQCIKAIGQVGSLAIQKDADTNFKPQWLKY